MASDLERYDPRNTWEVLQAQAKVLAQSSFVPVAYRGKPDSILAAGLYGQEIGLGITTALSYIHVVEGRPTLSAEGMVALVRARGHSIKGKSSDQEATVTGRRNDNTDEMTVTWTMETARQAKLAGKDNWQTYPQSMLWARAVSQLCRQLFPDVLLGLSYTPEEVRDFIDVDPATGEILPPCAAENIERVEEAGSGTTPTDSGEKPEVASDPADTERRQLITQLVNKARGLNSQERDRFHKWLDQVDIGAAKKANDYTLDQLHVVDAYFDQLEEPFE